MIRKIVLHNYMSHAHSEIELGAGLTALVGPNNCGKSALVDALRTVCANARGDYMVRHGENECWVRVETDQGETFEWRREGREVKFVINGQEVGRTRGGVPDDLHAGLKLGAVASADGTQEFDIHFGLQKEPIFLLDRPGAQAAMFFCAGSDAALLMAMQKRHKQRTMEVAREAAGLVDGQEKLVARVKTLDEVPEISERVSAAEGVYRELMGARALAEQLAAMARELERLEAEFAHFERRNAAIKKLAAPPAVEDVERIEQSIVAIAQAQARVLLFTARASAIEPLDAPPALHDTMPLEAMCRALEHDLATQSCEAARVALMACLTEAPEVHEVKALAETIEAMGQARDGVGKLWADVVDVDAKLRESQDALRRWAQENPTCPVCGGAVDATRLVSGAMEDHDHARA